MCLTNLFFCIPLQDLLPWIRPSGPDPSVPSPDPRVPPPDPPVPPPFPWSDNIEALDHLIAHLEHGLVLLRSASTSPSEEEDHSNQWQQSASNIPAFLDVLYQRNQVTATDMGKDAIWPLLQEVLGGIGTLSGAAFGCSMLAWAIDKLDKQHQNFVDCLSMLESTIDLLKHTRSLWQHQHGDNDLTARVAVAAFTTSVICASCSPHDTSIIRRFLGAATLETSISKHRDQIRDLQVQVNAAKIDEISAILKPPVASHTPNLLGRRELTQEVVGILGKDYGQGIVAVCLHGMGGVGKSAMGQTISIELFKLHQKRFVSCNVKMLPGFKEEHVPQLQQQIIQTITSRKIGDREIPNALLGREMLAHQLENIMEPTPILLYIDNVQQPEHLTMLLPNVKHLPKGSRLLVTSRRNEQIVASFHELGVEGDGCHSIEVKTLSDEDSRELFRREALKMIGEEETDRKQIIDANPSLKALENEVLHLCGGLPLALEVVGSFIAYSSGRGGAKSAETWWHVINAMKEAKSVNGDRDDELYGRLRVSIDALEESLRRDLLDLVACKLTQRYSKAQLESIFGGVQLQNLIDRHLLEDDDEHDAKRGRSRVRCHDVIASLVTSMASKLGVLSISGNTLMDEEDDEYLENIVCIERMTVTDVQLLG